MRRTLGREALNPPYSSFVSSGIARATETLDILRRAAHHTEVPITEEPGLRSAVEDRWREASTAAGKDASVADMRIFDVDLVEQDSQLLGQRAAPGVRHVARRWTGVGRRTQPDNRGGDTRPDRPGHRADGKGRGRVDRRRRRQVHRRLTMLTASPGLIQGEGHVVLVRDQIAELTRKLRHDPVEDVRR